MYSLSYNSLTEIKNIHAPTHLAGSSFYKHFEGKIIQRRRAEPNPNDDGAIFRNYIEACTEADYYKVGRNPEVIRTALLRGDYYADSILNYRRYKEITENKGPAKKRTYKLNKSKVRKKMTAFCRLKASKKFIAFYSISFPAGTPDDITYVLFNKWLTNLRRNYNLSTYIWVAERQNNNTIHFHLLTNNWLPIKEVNRAMGASIQGEVNKGTMKWGASSEQLYNGIDVDSPNYPKKRQNENREQFRKRKQIAKHGNIRQSTQWITKYLIKYVTKNDIEYNRLAYHSSRDISRLFTSLVVNDKHIDQYTDQLPDDADDYIIFENKEILHYTFKFTPTCELFNQIDRINNILYYEYHNSKEPPEDDRTNILQSS